MKRWFQRRDQYAEIYARCKIITKETPFPAKTYPLLLREFNFQKPFLLSRAGVAGVEVLRAGGPIGSLRLDITSGSGGQDGDSG
jgi:hypothetical protein